ncbi:glycosyltransferase family 4 protein [Scytonema sp. NUACC21]
MNILIITFHQIYPLETGASISQFGMIEYLSNLCNISLLIPEDSTITEQQFTELKQLLPKVKVYALDSQIQVKKKNIALTILNFIHISLWKAKMKVKAFLKYLFKVTNLYKSIGLRDNFEGSIWEVDFFDMYSSWNPFYAHSNQYVEKLNEIILQDKIELVQLEYVDNLNLVSVIPPHIKKVFVEHECIFLRIKSHREARKIHSPYADYLINFYKSIEISLLEKVDAVLTFNNLEHEILKSASEEKNQKNQFFISPFPILDRDFQEIDREKFILPNKLIFVGAEHHYPNKEAVKWFLEETAVEVFRRFGLRLYVVGKWRPDTVRKYKNHPSQVQFTGFIEDIYEFSKGSISIAPVRIGGGLKTKIMLAMAQGIPVITTSFAIQGINAKHLESVMIADETDSFCWALEYLLADLNRTFMICKNAQNIIRQSCSQSVTCDLRYSIYQKLLKPTEL